MNHVEGKVILVTGAGGGFGRILATMTAALGARVVATDVDADAANATADAIAEAGGDAIGCRVDVTRRADLDDVVRLAVDRFGSVDVLVRYAIDQPWGITINDITVRATGEDYVR